MTDTSMSSASGPSGPLLLWTVPAPDMLLSHDFGAISVVFNKRSGETHVLDPVAREALDILMAKPHDAITLAAALGEAAERPEAEFYGQAHAILAEFDRQGLVFPLASPA